jgi:hypothetical protein
MFFAVKICSLDKGVAFVRHMCYNVVKHQKGTILRTIQALSL